MDHWTADFGVSIAAEPTQDEVYEQVFGRGVQIRREHRGSDLDRLNHIDVTLLLRHGQKIRGQEKALRADKVTFNTVTIEYWQNRHTRDKGEFFHLDSHFYLSGYLDETETHYTQWIVVDVLRLHQWICQTWSESKILDHIRPTSHSNASFLAIPVDEIPDGCIIAKSEA